jgi:Lamin Tail Domain
MPVVFIKALVGVGARRVGTTSCAACRPLGNDMNNSVIAALAIALGLGAWISTGDSDERGASANPADSGRPGASVTQVDSDQRMAKPIRITKVSYDPPGSKGGSDAHLNREWVAIKSSGQRTRQLKGWTLWDASGHVFHFPQFRLRPDTTVTVHTGDGRQTRHDLYWGMENYVWNDTGDRAILSNREDRLIDRCRRADGEGPTSC